MAVKEKKPNKADLKKDISRQPEFLIRQSWITEKAGGLVSERKYVFIVSVSANKSEIKKAVESLYGVKVGDVNMVRIKGKAKRLGRSQGRTSDYKKAMVTLKEGQKIEMLSA